MKNYAPFASKISFSRRRFLILDHIVRDIEFTVKINYDKYEFGLLIYEYVSEIIKAIKENKELNYAGWSNSTVFVDESEVSEYFGYCVFFNSSNILKKKKRKMSSAIECVFREFKEKCQIKNALVNKFIGPKSVQCIEQNMDIYHERIRLSDLCKKHGIHYISRPWT